MRHPFRLRLIFLFAAALAAALVFHGAAQALAEAPKTVTVTDAGGRPVTIRLPVRRIVALNTDGAEVLRILRAGSLLAGASSLIQKEPDFWPEFKNLPLVGKWNDPDMEAIVQIKPDLVVCYSDTPGKTFEEKVGRLGIQILRMDFHMPETIEQEVETLGRVLGREKEAGGYIAWLREKRELVQKCLSGVTTRPNVYLEAYSDFRTSGPETAMHQICAEGGGVNVAALASIPHAEVTAEWLLSRAPAAMVKAGSLSTAYMARDDTEIRAIHTRVPARQGWELLPMVRNGNIHVLASAVGPGPRFIVGVMYMAKWLHPQACGALDPAGTHREYVERFQGVPLKGVYVFP
jgi:iron complex transport system substrate-binding protein